MEIPELTPARRLEIYKAALAFIYDEVRFWKNYKYGFCFAIDKCRITTWEVQEPSPHFGGMSRYPELYAYKPTNIDDRFKDVYWWDCNANGLAKRINILNEIISKMEAK